MKRVLIFNLFDLVQLPAALVRRGWLAAQLPAGANLAAEVRRMQPDVLLVPASLTMSSASGWRECREQFPELLILAIETGASAGGESSRFTNEAVTTLVWKDSEACVEQIAAVVAARAERAAPGTAPVVDAPVATWGGWRLTSDHELAMARGPEAGQTGSAEAAAQSETERCLRESEARFRQLAESIGEVFWLFDVAQERLIYVSPAYEKIWGRSVEELQHSTTAWIASVHPEDRERVREAAPKHGVNAPDELRYRIVRPDGSVRWIHDRAFPIRDGNGGIYRVAGLAQDVTEARLLEESLRQAQKMEAIGRLAGGIAHDFNNLLTVIQMQGSLLLFDRDPALEEGLRPILDAAQRAAALTRQLLTFSRQQVREIRALDLGAIVEGMARLLRRILGEDITLCTRLGENLPTTPGDAGMIEQVVLNLAVNARDAMPRGGTMTLALDHVEVPEHQAAVHARSRGGFLRLSVSDTGCGIAPEILPRIFEPFFTTKEDGKGTGLGLATVFSCVQQHDGWIEVASAPGAGTTFTVFLPAGRDANRATTPGAAAVTAARGGRETILLVEDEGPVRNVARVMLQLLGYTVLEAATGDEALGIWQQHPGPLDLVLTDLIMPGGLTGGELAARLRTLHPHLRILYMSGYSNEIVNRTLQIERGANFLQKPFQQDELAAIVRRALDEPVIDVTRRN